VYNNPKFGVVPWTQIYVPPGPDDLIVDEDTGTIWQISPMITWAISNNHMALFSQELRGSRWARSFASVMAYLTVCRKREHRPVFASRMATKLLDFAHLFESPKTMEWLLSMGADRWTGDARLVQQGISSRSYDMLHALLDDVDREELQKHHCVQKILWSSGPIVGEPSLTTIPAVEDTMLQTALKANWIRVEDLSTIVDMVRDVPGKNTTTSPLGKSLEHCVEWLILLYNAIANFLGHRFHDPESCDRLQSLTTMRMLNDMERLFEEFLLRRISVGAHPKWLRKVLMGYISFVEATSNLPLVFLLPTEGIDSDRYNNTASARSDSAKVVEHYLRLVEMLLRNGHLTNCDDLVENHPRLFSGSIMTYLLTSYGIEMLGDMPATRLHHPRPPFYESHIGWLALQASRLGENFLDVTRMIPMELFEVDTLRLGVWDAELESLLARAEGDMQRGILWRAYNLIKSQAEEKRKRADFPAR
jgi:hypothetical protein